MKTIQLLSAFLFVVATLSAQEVPFSFVKENVHWVERSSTEAGSPEDLEAVSPMYDLHHYVIRGESEVNGRIYKKVYCEDSHFSDIREGEDQVVYYCPNLDGKEYVLYHFNWKDPDYLHADNLLHEDFAMEALGSGEMVLADGNSYSYTKVPHVHSYYSHSKDVLFIQGIGLTQGIFSHVEMVDFDCYCYKDLVNLYDGDKLIYQNPLFTEQGEILASIPDVRVVNNLSILTRGGEVIFTLKNLFHKDQTILSVYNEKGEELACKRMTEGTFAMQNLPSGIYLYSLTVGADLQDEGKFVITQ